MLYGNKYINGKSSDLSKKVSEKTKRNIIVSFSTFKGLTVNWERDGLGTFVKFTVSDYLAFAGEDIIADYLVLLTDRLFGKFGNQYTKGISDYILGMHKNDIIANIYAKRNGFEFMSEMKSGVKIYTSKKLKDVFYSCAFNCIVLPHKYAGIYLIDIETYEKKLAIGREIFKVPEELI